MAKIWHKKMQSTHPVTLAAFRSKVVIVLLLNNNLLLFSLVSRFCFVFGTYFVMRYLVSFSVFQLSSCCLLTLSII